MNHHRHFLKDLWQQKSKSILTFDGVGRLFSQVLRAEKKMVMKNSLSKIIHDYTGKLWMTCVVMILFAVLLLHSLVKYLIQFFTTHKTALSEFGLAMLYFLLPAMTLFILIGLKDRHSHNW